MIPFGVAIGGWTASTVVPALAGVSIVLLASKLVRPKLLAAFGLGIFLWFFVDTIQGSANLDVFNGFAFTTPQVADVSVFILGVVLFFMVGAKFSRPGRAGGMLGIAALAAIAVGVHGFGEGSAFGATASLTSSTDMLEAFGGVSAGAAYALHKALEPMIVASIYLAYAAENKTRGRRISELAALALLFALPSVVGAAMGYLVNFDAGYGFAFGTGTSVFALALLSRTAFGPPEANVREDLAIATAVLVGFMLIYGAALLHQ
jgi:hypothetical protein